MKQKIINTGHEKGALAALKQRAEQRKWRVSSCLLPPAVFLCWAIRPYLLSSFFYVFWLSLNHQRVKKESETQYIHSNGLKSIYIQRFRLIKNELPSGSTPVWHFFKPQISKTHVWLFFWLFFFHRYACMGNSKSRPLSRQLGRKARSFLSDATGYLVNFRAQG